MKYLITLLIILFALTGCDPLNSEQPAPSEPRQIVVGTADGQQIELLGVGCLWHYSNKDHLTCYGKDFYQWSLVYEAWTQTYDSRSVIFSGAASHWYFSSEK